MENIGLALVILAIGFVAFINSPSEIDKQKLLKAGKEIEKKLNNEFNRLDKRIDELEKIIKEKK